MGLGSHTLVTSRLFFFVRVTYLMLLDATVYGLDRGSQMSASPFDYLFHTIAGYLLLFFKTARRDNVHGCCSLVGPRCQPL
jgi:hypothetical protein